jgi:uncharacterized protein
VLTLRQLRAHATSKSLFQPTTLSAALEKIAFVQADPIRSPARAQDLILRHRVKDYRAGDLERRYPALEIEEDTLYAYGFLPRGIWQLLQPRYTTGLRPFEKRILDVVKRSGETHPRELEAHFGRRRTINAWGGYSAATTQTLERLRHRGLLRIARREKGVRIYEPARPFDTSLTRAERLERLVLITARILAPAPERTLRATVARFRRWGNPRATVDALIRSGGLARQTVDGVDYVWPALQNVGDDRPSRVRLLAPFDPLVWDRNRFEHFWGWAYRFEAYTPPAKRVRGYYAMPLLWGDDVIGWANVEVDGTRLSVEPGFVGTPPKDSVFRAELEREVESLKTFLNLSDADDERSGIE